MPVSCQCIVVLGVLPLRGKKLFRPRPQNRILISFRGFFSKISTIISVIFTWVVPSPGKRRSLDWNHIWIEPVLSQTAASAHLMEVTKSLTNCNQIYCTSVFHFAVVSPLERRERVCLQDQYPGFCERFKKDCSRPNMFYGSNYRRFTTEVCCETCRGKIVNYYWRMMRLAPKPNVFFSQDRTELSIEFLEQVLNLL